MNETFLLKFVPEQWTPLERFAAFAADTYKDRHVSEGLAAITDHLEKYKVIAGLADDLIPTMHEDRKELKEKGYSSSRRSRQIAALCEVLVCELYSAIDGLRDTLYGIFRDVQSIQKSSNEKLFKRAKERKYGSGFPEWLNEVLAIAFDEWFQDLKELRTELTHGQVGNCSLSEDFKTIRYMNTGLGDDHRAFVIDDFIQKISGYDKNVRLLFDSIFEGLYPSLRKIPRLQICGMYKARWYGRKVAPEENLSFKHGACVSWDWFEEKEGLMCPLASKCVAYTRKEKMEF
ncbi:hypothetical protein DDZ13_09705 [Coraliomargarita sinensis]|uniref:Cthe-2314-like HEPN domain-containing protein n=1 Tax=Coraliomargarita sinensis TaxID=2174842 RepID=A0A317ZEM9_9BACT|nr:hypothetical protein [Coraliomargarita sinensis]PXA03905.1 hypothetical protein DDZ13_09705 [Coraliomargarita sinensis]